VKYDKIGFATINARGETLITGETPITPSAQWRLL
jgi:hypothetical protein